VPEVCNGKDDDCNGAVDDNPTDVGAPCGANCPGGLLANCVGACAPGSTACSQGLKVCSGSIAPAAEVCDGVDNDCDGTVDNHLTDPWAGLACCPTGTVSDCENTGAGTRCKVGTAVCASGGGPTCSGAVAKSAETCNGLDDDCDGVVDDVPQLGAPCTGPGIKTQGACLARWSCAATPGPGPGGLTCIQVVGPTAELCDGVDNDCNGAVDDNPTDVGAPCASACPGGLVANCVGQCQAGVVTCLTGTKQCVGSRGPSPEVCDGLDNDCNGQVDDAITEPWSGQPCCPTGDLADCANDGGSTRCAAGAFTCVSGGRSCSGAVARSPEVCDGVDDDCDGLVDDVAGAGQPCTGPEVKTAGACTAAWACGADAGTGPHGLTCTQLVGPQPELCNGLDDDCDGTVDNAAAVAANDGRVGQPCGASGLTARTPIPAPVVSAAPPTGTACPTRASALNARSAARTPAWIPATGWTAAKGRGASVAGV
jgi:hypothetical protein